MSVESVASRRRGRPLAADSLETRNRIVAAARRLFARYGYDATTNRDIAREAGITTGAIYHYFESKRDLYLAVFEEVKRIVFGAFESAAASQEGCVAKVHAMLDAAVELQARDSSLAAFIVALPDEARRHSDLAAAARALAEESQRIYGAIVRQGAARGELAEGVRVEDVVNLLNALTLGLTRYANLVPLPAHRSAVEAFQRLMAGRLFAPPTGSSR